MNRLLAVIVASILPACSASPTYSKYARDDAFYAAHEVTWLHLAFDSDGVSSETRELDAAASAIAARAGEAFTRSACVKATATGPTIIFELDRCESRFGGKNLVGRVGLALAGEGEQVRFEVSSSNLRIDDDGFSLDVSGTASVSGAQRVVTFFSKSHARDDIDSRTSSGTVTWENGSPCVTIDAQSTSAKNDVSLSSTLVGYQRCADRCPSAGEVTVQGEEGVFSGTFDGSEQLRVFAPNGSDRSYDLQCR